MRTALFVRAHVQYGLAHGGLARHDRSAYVGIGLLLLSLLLATLSAQADDGTMRPSLEISGRSTLFDSGRTTVTPIYSIAFGEVTRAERTATHWYQTFGPYGLDAVIWTPVASSGGVWKATDFRRPKTEEDRARFSDSPESFKTELIGTKDILPHPVNRLPDGLLSHIEHVVRYRAGGMRIALTVDISEEDAQVLVEQLRELQR